MKVEQIFLTSYDETQAEKLQNSKFEADLVFVFGYKKLIDESNLHVFLLQNYSNAIIIGCTTAGEIYDTNVLDDSVVITFIKFKSATVHGCYIKIKEKSDSFSAGEYLSAKLKQENLKHIFVLSEGLNINGSELVKGLNSRLPKKISLSGGLASDGERFEKTYVMFNDVFDTDIVAAVGFYGENIAVKSGCHGGWEPFGPERLVTRAIENVVYEFDSRPALELFKNYLGSYAKDLPAAGLLFPLSVKDKEVGTTAVRTILAVNEATNSLVFAGEIPEHSVVRLMKTNNEKLVAAAKTAIENSIYKNTSEQFEFALIVSCLGRKMVLKQQTEEEIEELKKSLKPDMVLSGFYAYGEIAPVKNTENAELQNQTLSVTLFSEN